MVAKTSLGLCVVFVTLYGCGIAPGPNLDASRMQDNLDQKTSDAVYPVTLITPQVITAQMQADLSRQNGLPAPTLDTGEGYRVGVGDIIGVTIWNHPELSSGNGGAPAAVPETASGPGVDGGLEIATGGQRVGNDGTIFFPTVGRVQVAGKTTGEIAAMLTAALARTVVRPQLEVHVLQYRSQQVEITGDLKMPGALPITDTPLTVVDAIARAGGALGDADLQRVQLTRGGKTVTLDIQAVLERGEVSQNVRLQNGDIVNVPDHGQTRVFVLGEILKPQTLFMDKGRLTLADAIANANSVDPGSANPRQILVIRRSASDPTKPELYRLDMSQVDAIMLATEFQLKPLDVVYVGTADMARFNRALGQLLPTAESLYLLNTLRY
jgi:polysaccharide biosynthesis/export protein